jgi:hypothetical protein
MISGGFLHVASQRVLKKAWCAAIFSKPARAEFLCEYFANKACVPGSAPVYTRSRGEAVTGSASWLVLAAPVI